MVSPSFHWLGARQLTPFGVLLAFAFPSAIAFTGFRVVLPDVVARGVPSIIAWPIIASVMLAGFLVVALYLLRKEAGQLNVSLPARMCLKRLTGKEWALYIVFMVAGLMAAAGAGQLNGPFMSLTGLAVPDYMPFFLDPMIDPMQADPEMLSPGFPLQGQWILLPLFALTLLLNILAEELYFRAWLLPKMAKYGQWGWVLNAVLFAFYHTFQLWLLPTILVGSLVWAFVIYSSKSIYPALLGHLVGNYLFGLLGIAGLVFA